MPGPQHEQGCPTWCCSAQLELLKSRSLFKTVRISQWRQPCSQQGWSHVLLGGKPGSRGLRFCSWHALSSQTLRRLMATVTCRETPQPGHRQPLPVGAGASEGCRSCSTPPLTTSGTETFVSGSFLINNIIYHKLTLQLYSEPKCYFTICCVYGKHSKGCVPISYKHNKYNHQRKSSHLLRIRSIWNSLGKKKSTLFLPQKKTETKPTKKTPNKTAQGKEREMLLLVSVYISERHLGCWKDFIKKPQWNKFSKIIPNMSLPVLHKTTDSHSRLPHPFYHTKQKCR